MESLVPGKILLPIGAKMISLDEFSEGGNLLTHDNSSGFVNVNFVLMIILKHKLSFVFANIEIIHGTYFVKDEFSDSRMEEIM